MVSITRGERMGKFRQFAFRKLGARSASTLLHRASGENAFHPSANVGAGVDGRCLAVNSRELRPRPPG